jgi:hypothetical protein
MTSIIIAKVARYEKSLESLEGGNGLTLKSDLEDVEGQHRYLKPHETRVHKYEKP